MNKVFVNGKRIQLGQVKASGGEADIYDIGNGTALKLFKNHTHQDYERLPDQQKIAKERLKIHQKKLPAFPKNLPKKVILPEHLAFSEKEGRFIVGYTMPFVSYADVIARYKERLFRENGASDELVIKIFTKLYKAVLGVHQSNVILGDFNDQNVLVKGEDIFLIDSDSFQFGPFLSFTFTERFVDPLLCDDKAKRPILMQSYNKNSDWFSFAVMLFQSLLYLGPYDGVYKPKDKSKKILQSQRSLKKISVFHDDVIYPKAARELKTLSKNLFDYFYSVFEEGLRGIFPKDILENIHSKKCLLCGGDFLGASCPFCTNVAEENLKEVYTGDANFKKVFSTSGKILFATNQKGKLLFVYYEDGSYKRENGTVITKGDLDPHIRFRINGEKTIFAKDGKMIIFSKNKEAEIVFTDKQGRLSLLDASEHGIFFSDNGRLKKIGNLGVKYPETIGEMIKDQSYFWTSGDLGFGFYKAGLLSRYFTFNPKKRGMNDSINIAKIAGKIADSTCLFSKDKIWFFVSFIQNGKNINRVCLLSKKSELEASFESQEGDNSWLSNIRGKLAVSDFLLSATDNGVVRVREKNGTLEIDKEFPKSAKFLHGGHHLFYEDDKLLVVKQSSIWSLSLI